MYEVHVKPNARPILFLSRPPLAVEPQVRMYPFPIRLAGQNYVYFVSAYAQLISLTSCLDEISVYVRNSSIHTCVRITLTHNLPYLFIDPLL